MDMPLILVVIEPHAPSPPCLARALMLSRYLRARLDILVYPEVPVHASSPAESRLWLEQEGEYVTALRQSIVAPDVEISIDMARRGTLNDTIAEKTQRHRYALIIKAPSHRQRRRDHNDWLLTRRCHVPLLLTAGRPWHPKARFLAAINAMDSQSLEQRKAALEAANSLKLACAAELDLVQISSINSHEAAQRRAAERAQLEKLGQLYDLATSRLHQLTGQMSELLRQFVAEREYDLLVVDVSDESRAPWGPSIGLALAQSLSPADCDLLMVQASDEVQAMLSGWPFMHWSPVPFWQWLGTD